ncbi:penicillin acylase family protein [Nocardioides dilutus]
MTSATPPVRSQEERRGWRRAFLAWPRAFRWATYLAVGMVLLLIAGLVTGIVLVRRPFPQVEGEARLPGLDAEVAVVRDAQGIPQLYADTTADLMRAQGYVHAQERFYEMDVRRHATAGRLAEMFGEPALESDRIVRTMGWREVAEQELALIKPETRTALEQYAEGVNAYLEDRDPSDISVHYALLNAGGLGYRPEPWTAVDSLAWLKAMAWDLRGNMDDEIGRALALASVGPDRTADLYPGYDYAAHQPIVAGGSVVDGSFETEAAGDREPQRPAWGEDSQAVAAALGRLGSAIEAMPALLGRGDGLGSNSWVVDGDHSDTGAPILANDPHLGVGMPGIWVQMGLHCRTVSEACPLDVSGFTFSGVPGVIIGHNADIAWGFTNLGPDVTDLYVERVRGDEWFRDGAWKPLHTRRETIEVRGQDDETLTVRSTSHGPLLSDVSEDLTDVADKAPVARGDSGGETDLDYALALEWTALQPGRTADAIFDLNQATSWDEFRAAVSSFEAPSQNLVYADREGHIGYQAPGRIPIRQSGHDGLVPVAGWLPENDWTGEVIPFDALPRVLDPEEGFIVTANQAVVGPDYPYFLTDDWDKGYRAERIRDLLGAQETWSVDAMADLQLDARHPLAPVLTPYLLDLEVKRDYYRAGQDLLREWDFDQGAGSGAAAYFNVVWRNLLAATFRDELPEELWPDGGSRWVAAVTELLRDPRNGWWDDLETDDVVEDRDDILRRALLAARDEMTARQALDADDWSWGYLHRLELVEPTLGDSGIGPVEWLVNRGGWEVGGGAAAVDATSWDASVEDRPYVVTASPSMRMVVSMADLDESRWVNLTGVSGHPFHEHYTDQTDLWARGELLPWPFTADAVVDAGQHTLTLVPSSED